MSKNKMIYKIFDNIVDKMDTLMCYDSQIW
jgi:hypothetical protein